MIVKVVWTRRPKKQSASSVNTVVCPEYAATRTKKTISYLDDYTLRPTHESFNSSDPCWRLPDSGTGQQTG